MSDNRPLTRNSSGLFRFFRLDLPRGAAQPKLWRWLLATAIAITVSLLLCAALAAAAIALDPSLAGYGHFQFSDYSRLTVVGVFCACVGWPIVAWLTTSGRRLYLVAAVLVVLASLLPDLWILHLGQPLAGVATLMLMHLGLGVVTYPAMVFIAPQRRPARD